MAGEIWDSFFSFNETFQWDHNVCVATQSAARELDEDTFLDNSRRRQTIRAQPFIKFIRAEFHFCTEAEALFYR